jgi:hypothetical protein
LIAYGGYALDQAVRRSLRDERMLSHFATMLILSHFATMLRYRSFARSSVVTYMNDEDWQHEDQVDGL